MIFASLVDKEFAFLVTEYGFLRVDSPPDGVGESAEYVKDPITVSFGWYKGEVDIDFHVSLEFAADHAIFRPYISRTFALSEVALGQDREAYASWAARPHPGSYITSPDEALAFLVESARIMRRYGAPILRGDLTLLEQITNKRWIRIPGA